METAASIEAQIVNEAENLHLFFQEHPIELNSSEEYYNIMWHTLKLQQEADQLAELYDDRRSVSDVAVQIARERGQIARMYRVERDLIATKIHYLLYAEEPDACLAQLNTILEQKFRAYKALTRNAETQSMNFSEYNGIHYTNRIAFEQLVITYLDRRPSVIDRNKLQRLYLDSELYP
jgi:hypothetical protein